MIIPDRLVSIGGEKWKRISMRILILNTSPQSKQPSLKTKHDYRICSQWSNTTVFRILQINSIEI